MSYFDDASLVMIPSGYKTSKVYSVKPTSGDGDLTFTRSNDTATRVGPDGLIEKVRTNLNLYSQDFTNAAYVTGGFGSLASVVANTTANPLNGAQDADTATFTAGGTQSRLLQQFSGLSTTNKYTYSIYVKAGTKNTIRIYGDVSVIGVLAEFNLSTGSVVGTPTLCTASIVSAGSGWYRCSITFNAQGAGSADCGPVSAVGEDGTAFIYGAQLEVSDFGATDYIATTSAAVSVGPVANVPRLDYLNSSCPRLNLEPQRTNVITFSEDITQTGGLNWVQYGGVTVTANNTTSPDGYVSADKMNSTGGVYSSKTFTAGTAYAISVFIKKDTATLFRIEYVDQSGPFLGGTITYTFATGAIAVTQSANSSVSGEAVDYGNGWIRLIMKMTANAAANYNYQQFDFDGGEGWVWGFQMEAGAYATSYIPTLGAAVTRAADAAYKTGISSLIGQTEGTIYGEVEKLSGAEFASWRFNLSDGTNANWIFFSLEDSFDLRVYVRKNGTTNVDLQPSNKFVNDGVYKIAMAYSNLDAVVYINGSLAASSTGAIIPSTNSFIITGNNPSTAFSTQSKSGAVKQALLFKTRLTNAQLAELTTL